MRLGWVWRAVAAFVRVVRLWWRWERRSSPLGVGGGLVQKPVEVAGDVPFEAASMLSRMVLLSVWRRWVYAMVG